MSLVVPNAGELKLLEYMVNKTSTADLILHLYSNNQSLVEGTVIGNLTEVTGDDYADQTLTGNDWTAAMVATDTATATHSEKTFTMTAAKTVYGYYVTNTAKDVLLWAERFSGAPFELPSGGGTIAITAKVTLD